MKKAWVYAALIVALAVGFFYMVLEKPQPIDPETDDNIAQGQMDKDAPGEPGRDEAGGLEDELSSDESFDEETDVDPDLSEDEDGFPVIEIGKKLPDFTLENLDGKEINLRQLEGKIVLINFWATSCPWCVKEMPDLDKLDKENDDLTVIAVNIGETKKQASDYIKEGGYDFEVLLDKDGMVARDYFVVAMPTSYFVDKDGIFTGRVQGMITLEQMNEIVEDIRNK